jgi:opacity protein-like surface antigen
MKFARIVSPLLVCAGLGFAASAHAEGWYAVIFGGEASSEGLDQDELDAGLVAAGFDLQSSSLDDSDTGFGATLGYQVNENFAAELSYMDLGEVSYQASNEQANPANESAALETSAAGLVLSFLGILPVSSHVEVYGRAGIALMDVEGELSATIGDVTDRISDSTDRSNMVLGAGAQYSFNDRFGVRLEWDRHFDLGSEEIIGESDVDLFSLGLRYNIR